MHHGEKRHRRDFLKAAGVAASAAAVYGAVDVTTAGADDGAARRLPFSLGLASYTLRKFDLNQTLAMTKRVGLEHICLKSFHLPLEATADQIAAAAEKVKAAGIDLYGGGVITMRTPDEVNRAFEYARTAGMRTIVGVPAPEVLPLVNDKVQQYDIEVAIHNHGPGDKIYPAPENAYEKVKHLDRRIGLCIDIGHTLRFGADPIADAERFADRLLDLHIKDVTAPTREGETVEIGRGVIDIPKFLRTLVKINYSRIAAFEYEKDADDPLPGLAESVGYVRGVLDTI
jgi:sugar phosphate isomerase/epimerase